MGENAEAEANKREKTADFMVVSLWLCTRGEATRGISSTVGHHRWGKHPTQRRLDRERSNVQPSRSKTDDVRVGFSPIQSLEMTFLISYSLTLSE